MEMWHYIVVICIMLFLMYLIHTTTVEGWHEWVTDLWEKVKIVGFSPARTEAPYYHQALTTRPYGGNNPMYKYFQNYERDMGKKYAHCTRYGCSTKKFNGMTVKPHEEIGSTLKSGPTEAQSISIDYYHDPIGYCSRNPHNYPCPNHWIKDSKLIGSASSMRIPKMKDSVKPQVVTYCGKGNKHELSACGVNDNERMLLVYPGKEDQGKC